MVLAGMLSAGSALAQTVTLPQAASPAARVMQRVGITDITVDYSRPSVRGREIWGGLVHYGMQNLGFGTAEESPWRAGANENTVITLSHDVQVGGKTLPQGSYALFIVVGEGNTSTVIFSNNATSWGSYFYSPEEDVLRTEITTEEVAHVETLTYSFPEVGGDYAVLALDWEKKRFPIRIEINVPEIVVTNGKQELRNSTGFSWQGPYSLAQYAVQNGVHMEEAKGWAQAAAAQQSNFQTESLVAQLLAADDAAASKAAMERALELGNPFEIHQYARQLIAAGKADEAVRVFEFNAKKHPNTWPVNYGLARGYSAQGDYKKALKYLRKALDNAPNEPNRQAIEANIAKLERGEDIN